MVVNKPVETRTNCNLSNQELVEVGTSVMLESQPVEKVHVNFISMQINDVSINLVTGVSFLNIFFIKVASFSKRHQL
jgi:hypothetical protein